VTARAPVGQPPPPAGATVFANCAALNAVYPHGVGRTGAVDHVSGSSKPVTDFLVNDALYKANSGSDRDGDGIACEKR
jgi:Excalibur calcium-binding domain